MSSIQRTAGTAGTFTYTTPQVPFSAPVMTIYSNSARTTVAQAAQTLTATGNPSVFTATYLASLAAGTYYLSFSTVYTSGQPAFIDQDDELVLVAADGTVATSYASVADMRTFGIATSYTDAVVQDALDIASRIVDNYTGRSFTSSGRTVTTHRLRGRYLVLPSPFATITSVTINDAETTDYYVEPWGILFRTDYHDVVAKVTATFGYTSIPGPIKRATMLIASELIKQDASTSTESEEDSESVSVGSYSYSSSSQTGTEEGGILGGEEVTKLLRPYKQPLAG